MSNGSGDLVVVVDAKANGWRRRVLFVAAALVAMLTVLHGFNVLDQRWRQDFWVGELQQRPGTRLPPDCNPDVGGVACSYRADRAAIWAAGLSGLFFVGFSAFAVGRLVLENRPRSRELPPVGVGTKAEKADALRSLTGMETKAQAPRSTGVPRVALYSGVAMSVLGLLWTTSTEVAGVVVALTGAALIVGGWTAQTLARKRAATYFDKRTHT